MAVHSSSDWRNIGQGYMGWGAIAYSPSIEDAQLSTNHGDQHHAESDAVLWCDVTGKVNDCQVVVSGTSCLSVATAGHTLPYFGRVAPTQDAADSAALDDAGPGGTILAHGCNGWRSSNRGQPTA